MKIFEIFYKKVLTYYNQREGDKPSRKGEKVMDKIAKALKDLAKAVETNDTVSKVTVKVELKKPKSNKAKESK